VGEETHLPIPTSSLQRAAISERRSQSHQVPRASLACHTGEHTHLMRKLGPPRYLGSSTVVPWFISLCFQRPLEVLPTQTHPCLVHVSSSNASPPHHARASSPAFHTLCAPKMLTHGLFQRRRLPAERFGVLHKSGLSAWKNLTLS